VSDLSYFALGLLAAATAKGVFRRQHREVEQQRLEDAANTAPFDSVLPPVAPDRTIVGVDGRFSFGVPTGFVSLSGPMLEWWNKHEGPSLATVADGGAEPPLPMLISVNDRGPMSAEQQRGFLRLAFDLAPQFREASGHRGALMTRGPRKFLLGTSPAMWFAHSGREGDLQLRNHTFLCMHDSRMYEGTMNAYLDSEERYLPVWWTALGTWVWNDSTAARSGG
jgi:hypothetical protein